MDTTMNGAADEGPFYQGQNAFSRGEQRIACPCDVPDRIRMEWLAGWREAKRYADVAKLIEAACGGSDLVHVEPEWVGPLPQADGRRWVS